MITHYQLKVSQDDHTTVPIEKQRDLFEFLLSNLDVGYGHLKLSLKKYIEIFQYT